MKDSEQFGVALYSIGTVKEATGLTERRIRYYETLQLLTPRRTQGNQRVYTQQDIERLKQIKQLLDNGISLREVREQLKQQDSLLQYRRQDEIERDADSYFQGKRLARGETVNTGSLYPLKNRADIIRRLRRDDDEPGKKG